MDAHTMHENHMHRKHMPVMENSTTPSSRQMHNPLTTQAYNMMTGIDSSVHHHHGMHVHNSSMHDSSADHPETSGDDHSPHSHRHHSEHSMTFHARSDDYVLFKDWQLSPGRVVFFTCIALVLLALLFQGIKTLRFRLGRKCKNMDCKRYILSRGHAVQTCLYVAQFVAGYFLMLSVMTYNVWLLVATVLGVGLGYFFCGWAEYEEVVRLQPITMKRQGRSFVAACGERADQELLPLSKDTTTSDITILTSNIACACDDQSL